MPTPLNLYVSSNGVDHGPLTLEQATEKVGTGEFKPDDLSWHQGVSGWIPLKQIPEWSQMNKATLPPLTSPTSQLGKKAEPIDSPSSKSQFKAQKKQPKLKQGVTSSSHAKNEKPEQKEGISLIGKLMVTFAILVFLSTLGVVAFLIYKNLDKFIPPAVDNPVEKQILEPNESEKQEETPTVEKSNLIDPPDPFAPPVDN
ncbi:MAG: DUF4339 domain-containing protein [Opitutae bacterium]|nr:DUF4339 domain-containing protein [Opitutae bacterium]